MMMVAAQPDTPISFVWLRVRLGVKQGGMQREDKSASWPGKVIPRNAAGTFLLGCQVPGWKSLT